MSQTAGDRGPDMKERKPLLEEYLKA